MCLVVVLYNEVQKDAGMEDDNLRLPTNCVAMSKQGRRLIVGNRSIYDIPTGILAQFFTAL